MKPVPIDQILKKQLSESIPCDAPIYKPISGFVAAEESDDSCDLNKPIDFTISREDFEAAIF